MTFYTFLIKLLGVAKYFLPLHLNETGDFSLGSTGTGKKTTGSRAKKSNAKGSAKKRSSNRKREQVDVAVKNEVMLIVIFALAIFLFLCVTGIIKGTAANGIRNVMFGIFGLLAYVLPVLMFLGFAFGISNKGNAVAVIKLVSGGVLVFLLGIAALMIARQNSGIVENSNIIKQLYESSASAHNGGGVLFGILGYGLYKLVGFGGTLFLVIVLAIIALVFITEKSFLSGVKKGGAYIVETAREDAYRIKEYNRARREEYDDDYDEEYDDDYAEEYEEKLRRADRRTRGVVSSTATTLKKPKQQSAGRSGERQNIKDIKDIHEITLLDSRKSRDFVEEEINVKPVGEESADGAQSVSYKESFKQDFADMREITAVNEQPPITEE